MKTLSLNRIETRNFLRRYGTVIGAVCLFLFFSIASEHFLGSRNLLLVLRQMSMLTIISLGFTFVMAAGGFDMSIAGAIGLLNIVFALTLAATGSILLAVLVALLVGMLIGSINGFLVAYVGLPDFIGTFAMGSILYGVKMLATRGNPVFIDDPSRAFLFIGQGHVGPIPFPVILMFFFVAVAVFVLGKTQLGRRVYAIGGNSVAAMYAGINVKKYRLLTFVISGLSVALASVILTSRLGSGQPLAGGDFLLDAIAVVFLSTSMFGEGEPTALGAFVGALIISIMNNGLTMLNVPYYFQHITKGGIVIAAVLLSTLLGQKLRIKF